MKKILILAAAVGLSALSSYAQGTINFANSGTTLVKYTNLVTGTGGNGAATNGTEVELFYQPGGGSAPAAILNGSSITLGSWEAISATQNPFVFTGNIGRFAGGGATTGTDVAGGAGAWLTVVGWNGGWADLSTAMSNNAPIGESTIFELTTGNPNSVPAGTPTALTANGTATGLIGGTAFGGLSLANVNNTPEPATLAIAGLGAAALLLYRRRKQ